MARSEARIMVGIWDDPDFVALSPDAQRMYLFLISQRDLEHSGVLALRERRWARSSAPLTVAGVTDAIAELERAAFVVSDEETEELLVRSYIRGDKVFKQPNVLRSAKDHVPHIASWRIRSALAVELQRIAETEEMGEASAHVLAEMREELEKGLANPFENPSGKGCDDPSAEPSAKGSEVRHGERGKTSTGYVSNSPSLFPLSPHPAPLPPHPAKTTPSSSSAAQPSAAAKKTSRGTRIPDDFAVTPEMVEWARQNAEHVDGRRETEKFVDYWRGKTGKDATKSDWPATWRNWIRNAADRTPKSGRPSAPDVRSPADQRVADNQDLYLKYAALDGVGPDQPMKEIAP